MGQERTTIRSPRKVRARNPDQPSLRVTVGEQVGAVFVLDEGEWIIGKDEAARIQLTDSGVSRRHAKIVRSSDGMVLIIDLQSTNGTFVNDARVETAALREGFRVGIGPDAELVFGFGEAATTPPKQRKRIENPLTRRELEIARLVAQGLTNPQIGAQLSIKPRTVSSHLDNIYARLKVSGRAALTRWIIEAGLGE